MQDKISIIDAGLACEDGAPAYFEIEYAQDGVLGTARVSMETCFDALTKGAWNRWERWEDGTARMEVKVWNAQHLTFRTKTHIVPLRKWVEERLFDEGFFSAARRIVSHLNTFNHERNNEIF